MPTPSKPVSTISPSPSAPSFYPREDIKPGQLPHESFPTVGNDTASSNTSITGTSPAGSASVPVSTAEVAGIDNPLTWQSRIRLYYGLLGSCYDSPVNGDEPQCTGPSLRPSFNASALALLNMTQIGVNPIKASNSTQNGTSSGKQVELVVEGLPTTMKITPSLFLSILLIVIVTLPGTLLPVIQAQLAPEFAFKAKFFVSTTNDSSNGKRSLFVQRWCNLLLFAAALLLVGTVIELRIEMNKVIGSFNTPNADRALPTSALLDALSNPLPAYVTDHRQSSTILRASAGNAFPLCYLSIALVFILFWLRRRQLRAHTAVSQARSDLEAQYGRDALAANSRTDTVPKSPLPAWVVQDTDEDTETISMSTISRPTHKPRTSSSSNSSFVHGAPTLPYAHANLGVESSPAGLPSPKTRTVPGQPYPFVSQPGSYGNDRYDYSASQTGYGVTTRPPAYDHSSSARYAPSLESKKPSVTSLASAYSGTSSHRGVDKVILYDGGQRVVSR